MSKELEPILIVWAIDPFEKETRPDALAIATFMHWKHATGARIQPVHVLNLEKDDDLPVARCSHERVRAARQASVRFVNSLGVDWTERPLILTESSSAQGAVNRLLRYARMERADLIAVSSHGRRGVPRAAIGSFAEAVFKRSEIPVLFLSQGNERTTVDLAHAFFATDLSVASRRAFERFVSDALLSRSKLTLFHQTVHAATTDLVVYPPGTVPYVDRSEAERMDAQARHDAESWAAWARTKGVPTTVVVSREVSDTGKLILSLARERGAGMIGVSTQSGDLAAFLLGSVARDVFRRHELPVWACGPEFMPFSERAERPCHLLKVNP